MLVTVIVININIISFNNINTILSLKIVINIININILIVIKLLSLILSILQTFYLIVISNIIQYISMTIELLQELAH